MRMRARPRRPGSARRSPRWRTSRAARSRWHHCCRARRGRNSPLATTRAGRQRAIRTWTRARTSRRSSSWSSTSSQFPEAAQTRDDPITAALRARPVIRPGRGPESSTPRRPNGGNGMTAGPQLDPADAAPAGPVTELVAALAVTEKARLLTGADSWRTPAFEAIGLRAMVTSDGPAGVRGTTKDERKPSASLPCPSALGATWDQSLVYELAVALGVEARSKGVDVLLAPTVNLMRTPLGGRGFECFAEDPVLTARTASAYVRGVQHAGVAATVKHYVGNDSETGRWTYDARIAEGVLREVYLVPFEACVREGGTLLIMTGYNKVNGVTMTEHGALLTRILKDEWSFGGVALSDWHAARSTVATAIAGLDLAMPGPDGPWGGKLAAAVRAGQVSEDAVDDKVLRILRVARRVGAIGGASAPQAA